MKRIALTALLASLTICGSLALTGCRESVTENPTPAESNSQASDIEISSNTYSVPESEMQQPIIIDSGYSVFKKSGNTKITYAVQVQNPNENYAIELPTITVTAKDENGDIIDEHEQLLYGIAANSTVYFGDTEYYNDILPTTVEITINAQADSFHFVPQSESKIVPSSKFTISNVNRTEDFIGSRSFTGDITNNSDENLNLVAISAIFKKDGKLIGGTTGYTSKLSAGATQQFDILDDANFPDGDFDSYELYALQWT